MVRNCTGILSLSSSVQTWTPSSKVVKKTDFSFENCKFNFFHILTFGMNLGSLFDFIRRDLILENSRFCFQKLTTQTAFVSFLWVHLWVSKFNYCKYIKFKLYFVQFFTPVQSLILTKLLSCHKCAVWCMTKRDYKWIRLNACSSIIEFSQV